MGKKGGSPKKSKKQLEEEALRAREEARREAEAGKIRQMSARLTADAEARIGLDREREKGKEEKIRLELESGEVEYGKSQRWAIVSKMKQQEREKREWEEFAACTRRPNIRREADIVTYEQWLEDDAEEARLYSVSCSEPGIGSCSNEGSTPFTAVHLEPAAAETSVQAVLADFHRCSVERALAVGHFTEFLVADLFQGYLRALADADTRMMIRSLDHIERIRTTALARHLDYATGHLIQFADEIEAINVDEVQGTWGQVQDDVFVAFWAFLRPEGFEGKQIELPKFKMIIELPKTVSLGNKGHGIGVRLVYTRYDSSCCFADAVLKSLQSGNGDGGIPTSSEEDTAEAQSCDKGWLRRDYLGRQPTDPGFGRESPPPRYTIGGVVHIDVVSVPQLRSRENGWLIRRLPPDDGPNYTRLPFPSSMSTRVADLGSCKVEYRLPEGIVVDKPQVTWRDMASQSWSDRGIGEVQWESSTRKVTFSATLLGAFAVTVSRFDQFPYRQWRISILPALKGSAVHRCWLTVVTAVGLHVKFELGPAGVHLVSPERDELRQLRVDGEGQGIFWSPAVLLTRLRDAGINLLPVDEDAQWLKKPREVKDASVELMTCNEIAEVVAMRYDIAGSRRNNAPECGKERIVFRARPNSTGAGLDDGDNEQQKEYKSIMAWSNKYAVISATEESDFDEPLEAQTHYSASIALTGSTESLATDADTAQYVDSVAQTLRLTRLLSFG